MLYLFIITKSKYSDFPLLFSILELLTFPFHTYIHIGEGYWIIVAGTLTLDTIKEFTFTYASLLKPAYLKMQL